MKSLSVLITVFVISILIMAGPAQALKVTLTQPNNANQGEDVNFDLTIELQEQDAFVPLKGAKILINGPDGFNEICTIRPNGEVQDCSLDLDVIVEKNTHMR